MDLPNFSRHLILQFIALINIRNFVDMGVRLYYNYRCRKNTSRSGGTGRRTGLKILRSPKDRTGSIPVSGTITTRGGAAR